MKLIAIIVSLLLAQRFSFAQHPSPITPNEVISSDQLSLEMIYHHKDQTSLYLRYRNRPNKTLIVQVPKTEDADYLHPLNYTLKKGDLVLYSHHEKCIERVRLSGEYIVGERRVRKGVWLELEYGPVEIAKH